MMFSISPNRILAIFYSPLTEEEMQEDPWPEQVAQSEHKEITHPMMNTIARVYIRITITM